MKGTVRRSGEAVIGSLRVDVEHLVRDHEIAMDM